MHRAGVDLTWAKVTELNSNDKLLPHATITVATGNLTSYLCAAAALARSRRAVQLTRRCCSG